MFYEAQAGVEPNLTLERGPEGETAQALLLNGVQIATIGNATGLTLDHIALFPREALPVIRGL